MSVSSRVFRGETGVVVLNRSDYRSVEEMTDRIRDLLEALSDVGNYSLKIQVVRSSNASGCGDIPFGV